MIEQAKRVLDSLEPANFVQRVRTEGVDRHYEVRLVPAVAAQTATHLFASMRDISARLARTEELNQALREQETIFEGTAAGLFVSQNRIVVKVNRQLETMLGYAAGEMIGMHTAGFRASREESDQISAANRIRMKAGETIRRQARYVRKDGSQLWVELINRPILANRPEQGIIGVVIDIDDQKCQEQELQLAVTELNTIFDSTGVGLAMVRDGRFVRCNPQLERMFGFSAGGMIGRSLRIIYPDDASFDDAARRFAELRHDSEPISFEQQMVRSDGADIWLATSARPAGGDAGVPGFILVCMDISVRKRQEQQLQLALLELQTIFDGTGLGIMVTAGGTIQRCNRQLEVMLGYAPGELLGRDARSLQRSAESPALTSADEAPALTAMTRSDALLRRDGSEVWVEITNRAIFLVGSSDEQLVSVIIDISARQQQDEQLRKALLEQEQIFETTLVGMAIIRDRILVKGNAAAANMLGFEVDELPGMSTRIFFASDEAHELAGRQVYAAVDAEGAAQFEIPLRHRNGSTRWASTHASALSPGHPEAGYIFGFLDIQERKRAENVLRETEALLEKIVENLPVMVSVKETRSMAYIRFNQAAETISGWTRGAAIGKTAFDLYPRYLAEAFTAADKAAIAGKKPTPPVQELLITGNGETRQILTRLVPIVAANGEVPYLMTIAEDVTEQRSAETALRDSEARFRQFADNIDRVFFITDPDRTICHYVNDAHLDVYGISADEARRNPRAFLDLMDPFDRDVALASFASDRLGGGTETEAPINHPGKGRRWIHSRTFPVAIGNGETRVFGIAEDVTDRRMREDARVEQAMQQRDVLIREVHHRIKNNLQGVAGLLEHTAQTKPAVAREINEVIGQIQAIAQVHGLQVRAGGELSLLAMTNAIVESLRRTSTEAFEFDNRIKGEAITIPEHEAVPLALVINELMTNAFKYCAPGSMVVAKLANVDDKVILRVNNAGKLPAGFDFETISAGAAGLSLVKALLPRKGASLSLRQQGTEVIAELALSPPVVRLSVNGVPPLTEPQAGNGNT
jgi:PAS domain S-box-containing protein